MSKSNKLFRILVAVCLFLVFGIHHISYAAEKKSGLQIAPLRSRPYRKPGDTNAAQITVTNNTPTEMKVNLSVEQFKVIDEAYHYDFIPGKYTTWIRLPDRQIALNPGESKKVAYSLAIPADAPPGGYYFAIFASNENNAGSTSFKEIKRVASLIYLDVGGKITKKITHLGIDAPWFLTKRSLTVDSRLANQGNSHQDAQVVHVIKPLIGSAGKPVNNQKLILPSSIRKLQTKIALPFWPGIYKLQVKYSPPQGGMQTFSQTIIYFPVWAWCILALILIFITSKVLRHFRHRKRLTLHK